MYQMLAIKISGKEEIVCVRDKDDGWTTLGVCDEEDAEDQKINHLFVILSARSCKEKVF